MNTSPATRAMPAEPTDFPPAPVAPGYRIGYLDSVRGLAAFTVLVYHFIGWRWATELPTKLAFIVVNGSDAVSLFFVLSGLVLSWRYFQEPAGTAPVPITWPAYRRYLTSRVIRLYGPFLIALALHYLYVHRNDAIDVLLHDFFTNRYAWFEEALLIRGKHDHYLPAWTLEVEVAGSLLLPFMVLLLRHDRRLFLAFQVVALVLGGSFVFWGLFHFGLGLWLAYYYRAISTYDLRRVWWYRGRWGVYAAVFLFFGIRHIAKIWPFGSAFDYVMGLLRLDMFHLTGLAAAALLAIVINRPRLQRVLAIRPLVFLGTISYGVYLLHWLFVVGVMDKWDTYAARFGGEPRAYWVLLALTVAATLIASTIFYYVVERPCIRLGKRVAAALGRE
ncbi:MAG: acyltransferase [Hymenobacteraceae bacterium]|nr:acyltransferase [Hymenobacteraceae bacterium]